jgi:hypothetical protein
MRFITALQTLGSRKRNLPACAERFRALVIGTLPRRSNLRPLSNILRHFDSPRWVISNKKPGYFSIARLSESNRLSSNPDGLFQLFRHNPLSDSVDGGLNPVAQMQFFQDVPQMDLDRIFGDG